MNILDAKDFERIPVVMCEAANERWCRKVNKKIKNTELAEVEMTFNRKSIKLMN